MQSSSVSASRFPRGCSCCYLGRPRQGALGSHAAPARRWLESQDADAMCNQAADAARRSAAEGVDPMDQDTGTGCGLANAGSGQHVLAAEELFKLPEEGAAEGEEAEPRDEQWSYSKLKQQHPARRKTETLEWYEGKGLGERSYYAHQAEGDWLGGEMILHSLG
eukprot:3936401-Rhodomonas_salina.5